MELKMNPQEILWRILFQASGMGDQASTSHQCPTLQVSRFVIALPMKIGPWWPVESNSCNASLPLPSKLIGICIPVGIALPSAFAGSHISATPEPFTSSKWWSKITESEKSSLPRVPFSNLQFLQCGHQAFQSQNPPHEDWPGVAFSGVSLGLVSCHAFKASSNTDSPTAVYLVALAVNHPSYFTSAEFEF